MGLTTDFPWLLSHFVETLHLKQSNSLQSRNVLAFFVFCKHHFSDVKVQSGTTRRSARYYNMGSRSTYNSCIHSLNLNRPMVLVESRRGVLLFSTGLGRPKAKGNLAQKRKSGAMMKVQKASNWLIPN